MSIETQPFFSTNFFHDTSDVESLNYAHGNLTIIVACSRINGIVRGLKVHFTRPSGFRLLDESDLTRYWVSDGFARGSYVLEVKQGGWSTEEDTLETFERVRREWLVVSGNACVSVFCSCAPDVTDVSWEWGDESD
ncbi:hypothetical protein HAV22_09395 [Massilia sp. TW-1]|uniref:Uncharacterized protein n=1 Tax=Telluria antibiotica TaxID=2717319 RepID=A0ABX0PBF1_9BURK|nr:hypothetical protein [Telluria antibiotica]NIA53863.1 hypothetical protein [Telluria antibiotica]